MHKDLSKSQDTQHFKHKGILLLFSFFLQSICYADINCEEEKMKGVTGPAPPSIGNFALPSPQRPGGLLSFGQHILNKGQTQLGFFFDYFAGDNKHLTEVIPSLLHGITDDFSINFAIPFTPSNRAHGHTSSGVEDVELQFEYSPYHNSTTCYEEGATVVANVTFPTGSTKRNPPTGLGSSSFFLGATYSRMYTDWFGFLSDGILFPTPHHGTKAGNAFLYQAGLGRNILSIKSDLTLAWLAEINGLYLQKSKIKSKTDPNSGRNIVYITPSLQLCTEKLLLQLGFGFPIIQHLFGHQNKNNYLVTSNFVWTF